MLDMAIVCKEAAITFIENVEEFEIVGPCVFNSDVIMLEGKEPVFVGVTQDRAYQKEIVRNYFGKVEVKEMMASALPYSLKNGNIDAIVVDIIKSYGIPGEKIRTDFNGDYSSYVLIVNKEFRKTDDYKNFVSIYNASLDKLLRDEKEMEDHLKAYVGTKTLPSLDEFGVKLDFLKD